MMAKLETGNTGIGNIRLMETDPVDQEAAQFSKFGGNGPGFLSV